MTISGGIPAFALFRDPVGAKVIERDAKAVCGCCGTARGRIYTGPVFIAGDEEPRVCPWCIADGSAAATLGCRFNDVWAMADGEELSGEDAALVEERTPGYVTWQENGWRACCGKPCVYLGEATEKDLRGTWAGVVASLEEEGEEVEEESQVNVFVCGACGGMKGLIDLA